MLCRVLDVHEVNPHEDPQSATVRDVLPFPSTYAGEGESTVIYRLVRCEPVEELPAADGGIGEPAEVRTLPRAGDRVCRPRPGMITAAMGFPPDPDEGLHVGHLHGDGSIPVTVDNGAVQRHVLIVGGIGSGKSYTRGVLGEELHRWGVPQVNIDVNGEMIDAARQMGGLNVRPGDGFTLPLGSLTREDLLEAVSGVNRGTNIETLIGYTFDSLRREIAQGRRSAFSVDELVAEIEVQAPFLKMEAANTLRPAQQRVKALDRLNYIGRRFDWIGTLKPGAFVNIDCRGLLLGDLRIITAAIARDLQDLAREKKIPFTVLSIDEFHLVAPNDDKMVSTQVLREIARIGRHYRLGLDPYHAEPGGCGPGSAEAHAHPFRAHHRARPARLPARDLRRRAAGDDPLPAEAASRHLRPDRRGRDDPARDRGRHPRPRHQPRRRDPGRLRGPA